MAETAASALLSVIFQKLADEGFKKYARSQKIDSELNELQSTLSHIQDLLTDASEKEITEKAVKQWLNRLQHLAYDIDDVLDDVATEAMRRKLSQESEAITSKVRNLIVPTCCTKFTLSERLHHKLDSINTKLQHLENQKGDLGLIVKNEKPKSSSRRNETSLLESDVVGREGEKEKLINKLLQDGPSKQNFIVVPIVGMGGVGKTTLARMLYNDTRVKGQFELMAWVCVSDEFDIFKISETIYQSVATENKQFKDINQLQIALKEKLEGKRFLVVLDDVWNENYDDWENLVRPFHSGATGSRVILTTRNQQLLKKIGFNHLDLLESLSHDDALSLLARHALDVDNFDSHETLKPLGEGIVEKCGCLPLAIKAIGRLLRTKTDGVEWDDVLNSEIWDLETANEIVPALRLSYHDLSADLKRLFAYCSLFPKDFLFEKEELMEMTEEALAKYRHMSFIREEYVAFQKFEAFEKARSLRTLIAVYVGVDQGWKDFYLSSKILVDLLPQLPLLRVLSLRRFNINEVPDFIGTLKHLRYLNLSKTNIKELPENVGNLYNLQTLIVSGCESLTNLPKSFFKLKRLRHFDIRNTPLLKKLPLGIGELKSLQTLTRIIIGGNSGFAITELKGLKDLQGEISIEGLNKVQSSMHAREANLSFKGINKLELKWDDGSASETLEKEVLNELKPRSDKLKMLEVECYQGMEFPNWVGDPSFNRLVHVSLRTCRKCTSLPPLGRLPSLEILRFEDMSSWEVWSTNSVAMFPCLRELQIKNCPNLIDVSLEAIPSLRVLTIYKCCESVLRSLVRAASSTTKIEIGCILGLTDEVWRGVIENLGAVEELSIKHCYGIRYLWESDAEASKVLERKRMMRITLGATSYHLLGSWR
ncbi:putative P-loop containing nucleoside triphosphate hydrolase, leucine-rich repeat domain superfamily [Helianthus annuus]|nr:putative P-loop containing nucleoside triphosphate hydrolase, leucine-rich repeat domain superfamily [Helianthus annuus]